ncbi:MAG: hypothetical protein ABSB79_11930, partial [Syntrophales bacterium]
KGNYLFMKELEIDASYCQMLSPFPKTIIREQLINEGLVTNYDHYERYNGIWANTKTRHLETEQLQYAFWYFRQTAAGWWQPSPFARSQGRIWTAVWLYLVKPIMKFFMDREIRKHGWEKMYQKELLRLVNMNSFDDLEEFTRQEKNNVLNGKVTSKGLSA